MEMARRRVTLNFPVARANLTMVQIPVNWTGVHISVRNCWLKLLHLGPADLAEYTASSLLHMGTSMEERERMLYRVNTTLRRQVEHGYKQSRKHDVMPVENPDGATEKQVYQTTEATFFDVVRGCAGAERGG